MAPVVLVDSREKKPLAVSAFPVEVVGLPVGDYGLRGFSDWSRPRFIVERKSIPDLVGSLTAARERFFREVEGLRRFEFAAILIEGVEDQVRMGAYRSTVSPASVLGSLLAIQVRAGVHVVWAGDAQGAAQWLEDAVRHFVRGVEKDFRALAAGT